LSNIRDTITVLQCVFPAVTHGHNMNQMYLQP